jgi:hypothetical protein
LHVLILKESVNRLPGGKESSTLRVANLSHARTESADVIGPALRCLWA